MNNLIQQQDGGVSITLKEITDLIGARHNDSMRKIEDLAKEASFGSLRKTRIQYNSGKNTTQEIDTYALNKKQAIAVGAKLNNSLLMKVIDRLEELESQTQPKTQLDLIIQSAQEMKQIKLVQDEQESRIQYLEDSKVINSRQRHALKKKVSAKAYEIKEDIKASDDFIKKAHMRLWKLLKDKYCISSYFDIPTVKFEESMLIINSATIEDII